MKKVILIVASLLLVVSGIAAVSAYEGHLINIKAHVENALGVETYEWNLGTVFPQEELESNLTFGLSESFIDSSQTRVSGVDYKIFYELKPIPDSDPMEYYAPLSPFLILSDGDPNDGNDSFLPQADQMVLDPPTIGNPVQVGQGELFKIIPQPNGPEGDLCDVIRLQMMVPVFEGWYNADTDPKAPWDYMLMEGEFTVAEEDICGLQNPVMVPHADLGIDLKIQVWDLIEHVVIPPPA